MKYALGRIVAEELSISMNNVKIEPNTRIEIKHARRMDQRNEKIWTMMMEAKIQSTDANPTPYNLTARLVGIFEAEGIESDLDKEELAFNMAESLWPYLRSAITNLTTNAFVAPLILPVSPTAMTPVQPDAKPEGDGTLS